MGLRDFFQRATTTAPILQTEVAECGLACVAMLGRHWGHDIDLRTLRRRFPGSLKGTNIRVLVSVLSSLGLAARPVKAELDHLASLKKPAILHWGFNHFVVLVKVGKGGIQINDPALGRRTISLRETSENFTGIAIEAVPDVGFAPVLDRAPVRLRNLMGRVDGIGAGLVRIFLLSFAIQAFILLAPLFLQVSLDQAVSNRDVTFVIILAIAFAFMLAIRAMLAAVRSWLTAKLSADLTQQWSRNVMAHLLRLPMPYFENRHLGDIATRFGALYSIQRAITVDFVAALMDGIFILALLVVLFFYNPWFSILALGSAITYGLLRRLIQPREQEARYEELVHQSREQSIFLESIRSMQVIKLLSQASNRVSVWGAAQSRMLNAVLNAERYRIVNITANTLIFGAERLVAVVLGVYFVINDQLTIGMLFAYLIYRDDFSARASAIIDKILEWNVLRVDAERLTDIVSSEAEKIGVVPEHEDFDAPSIEFRDVWFRYSESEEYVLRGVSFHILAGESVAIVGPSGSGKSTIAKLILGLAQPTDGDIRINSLPLKSFGIGRLRQMSGAVFQGEFLFTGTISDNISMGDESSDIDRVRAAAESAQIAAEIESMPMRYETLIGDLSSGLSAGQVQRILIARTFYRNPQLLVFDEATSNLDKANETSIIERLLEVQATRIYISHRPQLAKLADRIIELSSAGKSGDCYISPDGIVNSTSVTTEMQR